jgi:NhaA family Na+:H+ antiporter
MTASRGPDESNAHEELRTTWATSGRRVPRLVVRPLNQFLHTEASGGVLLFIAAAAALLWANIGPASYETVWSTNFTVELGRWSISEDLRHWINDAAMARFFFVVGLEIKRELVSGELRDRRVAALPIAAAVGGMVVPGLIYLALNAGGQGSEGWGIPMATDIAFAVGVLALIGRGLPSGLKLFLLTLAIVDDIGAILVIALFYSGSTSPTALALAVGLLVLMGGMRRLQVRAGGVYLALGIGVWLAVYESGIHATIAGIAIAIVTPAVAFQRPRAVSEEARRVADETSDDPMPADVDAPQWLHLAGLSREAVSPLARLEQALHPWTSYVIVPVFALANAGVRFGRFDFGGSASMRVVAGIMAGLLVGKTAGIAISAIVAGRLGVGRLPAGVNRIHMTGVSALGGIGFTVSLFIASLAFESGPLLDAAKVGVLAGSMLSGLVGGILLGHARRASA